MAAVTAEQEASSAAQADNEVSQIIDSTTNDKPLDFAAMSSNTQVSIQMLLNRIRKQ